MASRSGRAVAASDGGFDGSELGGDIDRVGRLECGDVHDEDVLCVEHVASFQID